VRLWNVFELQKMTDKCFKKCIVRPGSSEFQMEMILVLDLFRNQYILSCFSRYGQFRAEMRGNVYGQIHGRMECHLESLREQTF